MVELKENELVFRFPEVHDHAICRIGFQRTLRIPDDNRDYSLPPGLGRFHLEHIEDHARKLSDNMTTRGGVMLPMYQSEAMWINFSTGRHDYPFAIKIAAGKINAVTGEILSEKPSAMPQDYVVAPDQPWLDGFCVQQGLIRQFVAMPLREDYTAEEQIMGTAEFGGLQIMAYPMKRSFYEEILRKWAKYLEEPMMLFSRCTELDECSSMGFAPGGLMRQEIYADEHGIDAWETEHTSRCFIHVLNSTQWTAATGKPTPGKPPSAKDYTSAGLPWFEYYDETRSAVSGSQQLAGLDSLAAKTIKKGKSPLEENEVMNKPNITPLGAKNHAVSDGKW
jgi:hypothetical protein